MAPTTPPPSAPAVSAAQVQDALAALYADAGVECHPRVLGALGHLVATCAPEARSAYPDDCRYVVTEGVGEPGGEEVVGHDSLAEAFESVTRALRDGTVREVQFSREGQ